MHPLTYQVSKAIPLLEFEQFKHVEDRERIMEVRALAQEQVADDSESNSPAERYGKSGRVFRPGEIWLDDEYEMWPERTEKDKAIAAVMDSLLDATLSPDERMLVRLRYGDRQESYQDIAARLGVSRITVRERFEGHALKGKNKGKRSGGIHAKVRASLLLAYGPREEVDDGPDDEEEGR